MLRNAPLFAAWRLIRGPMDATKRGGPGPAEQRVERCTASGTRPETTKKAPQGLFQTHIARPNAQCALAQTFFLVKYIRPVNRIRNTNTCNPIRLRASMCGSAVHM